MHTYLKLNTGGGNIAESILPENFGDIGTFGDMRIEITFLFKKMKNVLAFEMTS
jgi:hypothetical protein